MNVGYANKNTINKNLVCPICKGDIYVNKYGTDYMCMNKECSLNKKASVLISEIQSILKSERGEVD